MSSQEIDYRRVYKELKKNEQARRRAALAQAQFRRPHKQVAQDLIRTRVVEFVEANPNWTPEDLVRVIGFFTKYYGISGKRYEVEGKNNGDDLGTTQGSSETPS